MEAIDARFSRVRAGFWVLSLMTLFAYKTNAPFFERITRELDERASPYVDPT